MLVHIALPRAINLGSHNSVSMADFRKMLTGMGFEDARTLLNSGNLVLRSTETGAKLEGMLEREAEKQLGLRTQFMVRTAAQWKAIVKANPFPKEAKRDPGHLLLMVCKKAPGASPKATGVKRETFKVKGKEIYIVYPDGVGRSRLKIDAVGTARNWNTVLKLADLTST